MRCLLEMKRGISPILEAMPRWVETSGNDLKGKAPCCRNRFPIPFRRQIRRYVVLPPIRYRFLGGYFIYLSHHLLDLGLEGIRRNEPRMASSAN